MTPHKPPIEPGESYAIQKEVTKSDVATFANLSGDHNPIHSDEQYAATTQFKRPIAPGMLTASWISGVLGSEFPGPGTIYLSQNLNFKLPVYIGDRLTVRVTVKSVRADKPIVVVETDCLDSGGKLVLTGEAVLYCPQLKGKP